MGKKFGNLAFIRGIVYYKLSPYEMKPFANVLQHGLPNVIPRTSQTVLRWLPCESYFYIKVLTHLIL